MKCETGAGYSPGAAHDKKLESKIVTMRIQQWHYFAHKWNKIFSHPAFEPQKAKLVLCFGNRNLLHHKAHFDHLRRLFPQAHIVLSSTAGEILSGEVYDDSIVVTAMQLERTQVRCAAEKIIQHSSSLETGKALMKALFREDLRSVLVFSDGVRVNGTELVNGFNEISLQNMRNIPVTGGLAGDGVMFRQTLTGLDQAPEEGMVVAVGFYGDHLKIGHGSFGGWEEFGSEMTITRAERNVLYEIDGRNALELYKECMGPFKDDLPGAALLFPLSLKDRVGSGHVVRTILGINEKERSMIFAGNMPEGSTVRMMKADLENLIAASSAAAGHALHGLSDNPPGLALLISCVGRKLVLKGRTNEEILAVNRVFGGDVPLIGFYSYGEISPLSPKSRCELHNQTMTITTFSEI